MYRVAYALFLLGESIYALDIILLSSIAVIQYLLGGSPPSMAKTVREYSVVIVSTSRILSIVIEPVTLSTSKLPACRKEKILTRSTFV